MAPQAKRLKTETALKCDALEALPTTPVSRVGRSRSKHVHSKKPDDGPKSCDKSDDSTLDPELLELLKPKSKTISSKRKSKPLNDKPPVDSPGLSELLDMSSKKTKAPKTVDEVFEKYMEQDPYASIWRFIPQQKAPSPDRPLTFFSPTKDRPRTLPRRRINRRGDIDGSEPGRNCNLTVDLGRNSDSSTKNVVTPAVQTPLFDKRLNVAAYSPCSTGKDVLRFNEAAWSGAHHTHGPGYCPGPTCSTPTVDSYKTPSADACRPPSNGFPLSGVKALFQERSWLSDTPSWTCSFGAFGTDSPADRPQVPEHVRKTILLGVTCFVDVRYNKENRAKYVQNECISLGAKVEKNFTKKVTHVVFKGGRMSTYIKAKENNIPLVSLLWLEACKVVGNMVDPALYPPTEDEKYRREMPLEEHKKRERFLQRSRAFLERLNGKLPLKPLRSRAGKKQDVPVSATEGKKKTRVTCSSKTKLVEPDEKPKVPKKLDFNQGGGKKQESGDSDYVSESDEENGQSKRRKSAPAEILGEASGSGGEKKTTFDNQPKIEEPEPSPECRSSDKTPEKGDGDLLKVLTGGFTTRDKKKRKLFDPNQSLMSQPLPVESTPVEMSPYVKASPPSKRCRSGSRSRTVSSKKPPSRSQSTSSKTKRRVKETNRPVTARKSLVPLMEQHEEEDGMTASTSRNSLACFDLSRKGKSAAKCQPHIAFTSIPKEALAKYKAIIRRLGTFAVDSSVTKHTTHLLTSTPVKRTVNLLKAIARGCWILDVEWLINSEQSGKWMSEEPFEQKSFSEAVTASRLEKQAFGKDYSMDLFSECGPIFVDSDVQPPRPDLVSLLKICCAKVVTVSANADIIVSARPLTENSRVDVVSHLWVLDSITHYKRMELTEYRILPSQRRP